jgi:hypothetical protein
MYYVHSQLGVIEMDGLLRSHILNSAAPELLALRSWYSAGGDQCVQYPNPPTPTIFWDVLVPEQIINGWYDTIMVPR